MKLSIFIYIPFAILLVASCLEEPDCNSETSNLVKVKFYSQEDNTQDTIRIISLTAAGVVDTVLMDTARDVSSAIRLPLRSDQPRSTFIFNSEYGRDTLIFEYHIGTRLVSEDCGIEQVFSELEVVRSDFDSVRVLNNILSEASIEDVKIFN